MHFSKIPLLADYRHRVVGSPIDWTNQKVVAKHTAVLRDRLKHFLTLHHKKLGTLYYSTHPGEGEKNVQNIYDLAEQILRADDDWLIIPADRKGKRDRNATMAYICGIFYYDKNLNIPRFGRDGMITDEEHQHDWVVDADFGLDFMKYFHEKNIAQLSNTDTDDADESHFEIMTTLKERVGAVFARMKR